MKEEWLFPGALIPVDRATTLALVAEIKRLIDVVGGLVLQQGPDYERGFVDGMSKQAQKAVAWLVEFENGEQELHFDKPAVGETHTPLYTTPQPAKAQEPVHNVTSNGRYSPLLTHMMNTRTAPQQRPWVDLTDEDIALIDWESLATKKDCVIAIEAKLKEKNFD